MGKHLSSRIASLLPVPAALVTYRSASGLPQIVAASWVAIVCNRSATLSVAFGAQEESRDIPVCGGAFAVNLLPDELLGSSPFLEALVRRAAPLTLTDGKVSGVPVIAECPVRIECVEGTVQAGPGQRLLRGRMTSVSMESPCSAADSPAEFFRVSPFAHPRLRGPAAQTA